jgi:hypothetical protein
MNTFLTSRIPGASSTKLVAHLLVGLLSLGLVLHGIALTKEREPESRLRPLPEMSAPPAPMLVATGR